MKYSQVRTRYLPCLSALSGRRPVAPSLHELNAAALSPQEYARILEESGFPLEWREVRSSVPHAHLTEGVSPDRRSASLASRRSSTRRCAWME
jgi:hypothetical protein